MKRTIFLCSLAVFGVFHAAAQEERRQAVITGQGGSPKCTIEVEVDVVADVEIQGAVARLHTLSGSPATWRRFECNQPMPSNPVNFHFRGIDGRGRQTLIGDPGRTGTAVIRIEDPKSGREGYTFDIEWGGSAAPFPVAGPGRGPITQQPMPGGGDRGDRDRGPDRGGDRDRDHDGHFGADDAIHQCSDAARAQLRGNGYRDTTITSAKIDGEPGRGDWIYGTLSARRGPNPENFGFACSVDMEARRIGNVNVRPANDGYWGGDAGRNRFSREQAFRACGDAVQDRLRHDGYTDFRMGNVDLDNRPGNNDWVVGGLGARRGGFTDNFEFSCSIDFDDGRVRSINVNHR